MITKKTTKLIYTKLKCPHPECSRLFECASLLRHHVDFAHRGILHFVCDHVDAESGEKCEKACELNGDLAKHKKSHTNVRPFVCEHVGCVERFKTNNVLTKHQKRHSDVRPFVCEHVGCGESFHTNYQLQSHWIHRHASEEDPAKIKQLEKNKCEDCGEAFLQSDTLKDHRLTTHTAKDDPEYIAFRAKENAYRRHKYANDEEFRTAILMRRAMNRIFDKAGKEKDSSTELLLGVSYEEAVLHLNDNSRGLKLHDDNIHIDHIRPIASFSLKKCKLEILQCSNINNLQLLPGPENEAKSDRFNDADKEAYEPIRKIIAALMPAWLARGECSCGQCT
jgi:hypothetical protein